MIRPVSSLNISPRSFATALVAVAGSVLLGVAVACSDNGPGRDPCFNAEKSSEPNDDARILLFNVGNEAAAVNVRAQFTGPNGQSRVCDPIRTSIGDPTNVVFNVSVGDQVSVSLSRDNSALGSKTCTVSDFVFDTNVMGSPGNAEFTFEITNVGLIPVAAISCGPGFEFGL